MLGIKWLSGTPTHGQHILATDTAAKDIHADCHTGHTKAGTQVYRQTYRQAGKAKAKTKARTKHLVSDLDVTFIENPIKVAFCWKQPYEQ